jgi:exopolysaccharide production protein ExoZ
MSNNKNLSILQLLRGIAAVLVVLFHATGMFGVIYDSNYFGGIFKQGKIGVDLFFVLSGFIIYYIHHKDRNENGLAKKFVIKRLIRIYPIYWVTILCLLPIYFIVPSFGEGYYKDINVIINAFLLVPQENDFLTVAWSLSYELMFYLFFGFVLFTKKRTIAKFIFGSWMVLSALSPFFKPSNFYMDFFFNTLNIEFFYGIIVAYLVLNFKIKFNITLIIVGVVTACLAMYNTIFGFFELDRAIGYGIPSALIILGCVALEFSKNIKTPRLFVYLGDASYSIYLTHYPALSAINKVFSSLGIFNKLGYNVTVTLMVIFTIIAGLIFHSLIEKPMLKILRTKLLYSKSNSAHSKKTNAA